MPAQLLPDLITEILLRLPAKSLLRFRCLSNSFHDVIDSSNFVKIHLKRSIETRIRRKLIFTNKKDHYSVDFDDGLSNSIRFNIQFPDLEQCWVKIVDTCHGLILLRVQQKVSSPPFKLPELFLWNPTTRKLKKLPDCHGGWPLSCGLGYDSTSDDYKVVKLYSHVKSFVLDSSVKHFRHQVWVFSLKLNSWRWTQYLCLENATYQNPAGFANGFLYWPYVDDDYVKVGCFDFANEAFFTLASFYSPNDGGMLRKMPGDEDEGGMLPKVRGDEGLLVNLVVLEGNVLMKKTIEEFQVDEFYSPVVDAVSALPVGNWSRAFAFDPRETGRVELTFSSVSPLAYSKDGACILLYTDKDIFWYDIEKKTCHEVKFLKEIPISDPFKYHVIWESLVSLGNG